MNEIIKKCAREINERFPNAPLPGRGLMMKDRMKIHHEEIVSYDDCIRALAGNGGTHEEE